MPERLILLLEEPLAAGKELPFEVCRLQAEKRKTVTAIKSSLQILGNIHGLFIHVIQVLYQTFS